MGFTVFNFLKKDKASLRIVLIDPNVQRLAHLDRLRKKVVRLSDNITVFTLGSLPQRLYFEKHGIAVRDICEQVFTIEQRFSFLKKIGLTEKYAYLSNDVAPDFPYNPLIISGGIINIISSRIIQLIALVKYCSKNSISDLVCFGDDHFLTSLKACLKFYNVTLRLRAFKFPTNKSWELRKPLKNIINDLSLLCHLLFTGNKILFYINSRNVINHLSSQSESGVSFSVKLRSFFDINFSGRKSAMLENNAQTAYKKIVPLMQDEILEDAIWILHTVSVRTLYSKIVFTILLYDFLKRYRTSFSFVTELNHGEANLFIKLFSVNHSIFIQHAIIPGTYRADILYYIECQKVYLYSRFTTGFLAPQVRNCKQVDYTPYIHRRVTEKCDKVDRIPTILFAPTTLGIFLSDYEFQFLTTICQHLSKYCIDRGFSTIAKFHQKTPYFEVLQAELEALPAFKLESRALGELMIFSDVIISSVNSNTIIEGFFYEVPVVVYNPFKQLNYLSEYMQGIIEVHDITSLLEQVEVLLRDQNKRNDVIGIQNIFLQRYITQ